MRPRTQKQPQVKKELCRALDDVDVDVDVLMVVELDGIHYFSSLGCPNLLFLGLPFFFCQDGNVVSGCGNLSWLIS